jgi:thiol-disulfide isomerase/thioredoxin
MRKAFPFLFAAIVATHTAAQSGRRTINPPPPTPSAPAEESPISSRSDRGPMTPNVPELRALPDDLLKRQLKSVDQGSFRLSDFAGKVVVVNLWATWCGPCRMEVPDYEKIRKDYAARAVEFIGLTTEDPRTSSDRVKKFAHDFNFGFRLGWADRDTARELMNGRSVIPQTLVIAADGRIVNHWRGYSRGQSSDRLRGALQLALSEASPATQKSQ